MGLDQLRGLASFNQYESSKPSVFVQISSGVWPLAFFTFHQDDNLHIGLEQLRGLASFNQDKSSVYIQISSWVQLLAFLLISSRVQPLSSLVQIWINSRVQPLCFSSYSVSALDLHWFQSRQVLCIGLDQLKGLASFLLFFIAKCFRSTFVYTAPKYQSCLALIFNCSQLVLSQLSLSSRIFNLLSRGISCSLKTRCNPQLTTDQP